MKQAYAFFYVLGREERPFKNDIDTEQLADKVLEGGGSIHDVAREAAAAAASSLRIDRKKRVWLEEYSDEIREAGDDPEEAYQHYLDGRIDTVTADLEDEIVELITETVAPGDTDDEEDEDDEEEEDDK